MVSSSDTPADAASPRILIVDDVADNRTVLARQFGRRGYETIEAENGRQALLLIEEQPFDAVLLDIVMPDMDGLEVLSQIRSRWRRAALPVIAVSALTETSDVVRALALGANDYVTKPVDFEMAHARIRGQIERKRDYEKVGHLVSANREVREVLEAALNVRFEQLTLDAAALAKTNLNSSQKNLLDSIQTASAELLKDALRALEFANGPRDLGRAAA